MIEDKEALAREAQALLNNETLRRAIEAIEKGAIEEMLKATTDDHRRLASDRVHIVRGIPELLRQAVMNNQPRAPKVVA